MKKYSQIQKDLGYDLSKTCPFANKKSWYAYKNGKVEIFETKVLALAYSSIIEECIDPDIKCKIDDWWETRNKQEYHARDVWRNLLRDEYSYLKDEIYNICYNKAWENGHHAGYDEVIVCMEGIVEFAEEIIKAHYREY